MFIGIGIQFSNQIYITDAPPPPPVTNHILTESGDVILTESGDKLTKES